MKKKLYLAMMMIAMACMVGCGNSGKGISTSDEPVTTTEEETEEESEEPESEESETEIEIETETEEPETETKNDDDNGGMTRMEGLFGNGSDGADAELFVEADKTTGFLSSDAETIDELVEYLGSRTIELSQDNMDFEEDALFHFEVYHEQTAGLINTGDRSSYLSQIIYNDENFFLVFGDDSVDAEEIEVFCQVGTTVEYWAVGSVQDGMYMLVPIIAGNEENGYYIVRPACIATGMDMSDTMSLVEQGVDFTTIGNEPSGSPAKSGNGSSKLNGDEQVVIEIKEMEEYDDLTTLYCDVTNGYPVEVYLEVQKVYLNGEEITDSVTSYIWAGANSSRENTIYIDDYKLHAGDEFIIQGMLEDNNNLDELGPIEFVFNMESR